MRIVLGGSWSLENLQRPLLCSVTHTIQKVSMTPYSFKPMSLKQLVVWEEQEAERIRSLQLHQSTSSHVLSMISSNTLRQDHDCILLFVPSEDKLLLILLLYKYEKAAFARYITTRLPGMCQSALLKIPYLIQQLYMGLLVPQVLYQLLRCYGFFVGAILVN